MEPRTQDQTKPAAFVLPAQLSGKTSVNHLLRELEELEDALIEDSGNQPPQLKATGLLSQTAEANGYNLLEKVHRQHIAEQLTKIRDHAPVVHISFAAEPSPKVTETVVAWLRSNIHRYILLQVGLQPAIAAGCVLRTPNKIFDMSLGASLQKQTPYLSQLLKAAASGQLASKVASTPSLPANRPVEQAGKP
ncbi:hypothetical protein HYS42_01110 [Candidatus Saccharibacteria bacterium]|nr:hypothetical protein [Candidatus Saccharibacteria bacterium]